MLSGPGDSPGAGEAPRPSPRTITDVYRQDRALAGLATVIAEAGDLDRAKALARTITDPDHQAEALADLATPTAQAGDQSAPWPVHRVVPARSSRTAPGHFVATHGYVGHLQHIQGGVK
ncbi:MAG TPA: hypothetical protein VE733_01260 [Streptosporangiaceae bacterium]|jgi:hypothetical protein|nr:hypothetical protein [Streptosporangiaceae bacterium]